MNHVDRQSQDKLAWLERMVTHVKPGRIVEFGCGSGFVLEFLAARFAESLIVGIDRCERRLEEVIAKALANVIPMRGDITRSTIRRGAFDTAIFVGSLHEIYSSMGQKGVVDALRVAYEALGKSGVVIIQDFLKPRPRLVEMSFKNEEIHEKFLRFAGEFRPRKVDFKETGTGIRLDIADAVEFISKYRSPTEEDWNEEMGETHFFFTGEDHKTAAQMAAFAVNQWETLTVGRGRLDRIREDIEFEFENEYSWVQVVLSAQ